MKVELHGGKTNKSYKLDDKYFFQEKTYTGFNHGIDYNLTQNFTFVPKLIANSKTEATWDFIDGKIPEMSKDNLIQIGRNIRTLHMTDIQFPKNNIASRVKNYQKTIREKGLKISVIDDFYRRINLILRNSENIYPCHNDLWPINMLQDEDNKIWFLDWEYATMGDKHFDLAYFICASNLNSEQIDWLYQGYAGPVEEEYILQNMILVNYLVVLWVNAQTVKHFDDKPYIDKIYALDKEYQTKKQNKSFQTYNE
ncbi:phosphotransferase [Mycoplasma sp. Ms02]|uniref:phosphotransferase n=1 Tax=Mycoplasma sp. Ms02 TaxID=353851 RepID=UPI001C88F9F5|nr:phosphotransferase [Mycoplasma sp. Ms02]QZE12585.1 phosphotransferase [Mycoplasma sp. Ms02]